VRTICDLEKQGNVGEVVNLLKGYFTDKRAHPWHRIYSDIEKYWPKKDKAGLKEMLLHLRGAIFGAFQVLSVAMLDDLTTERVLETFLRKKNWTDARRSVRNMCSDAIRSSIRKGEVRYLLSSALQRDGFGYLVERLEDAQVEQFKRARPKVKRGKLDLTTLESTAIGSGFLREMGVTELKIPKDDPLAETLLESYEHYLVEYEVSRRSEIPIPTDTEQVTLNGTPVEIEEDEIPAKKRKRQTKTEEVGEQADLTEFLKPESKLPKKKSKKTSKAKSGKKSRRSK